jgi:hypothetical protein
VSNDLNEVREYYATLRKLIILNPGGWDGAQSRARVEQLCQAGMAALDDSECQERLEAVQSQARELYSRNGHHKWARRSTSGADYLRWQILIALERCTLGFSGSSRCASAPAPRSAARLDGRGGRESGRRYGRQRVEAEARNHRHRNRRLHRAKRGRLFVRRGRLARGGDDLGLLLSANLSPRRRVHLGLFPRARLAPRAEASRRSGREEGDSRASYACPRTHGFRAKPHFIFHRARPRLFSRW